MQSTFLPTNYSLTNLLIKRADSQLKSNRYVLSAVNLAAFGLFAGVGSSIYHTLALTKFPVIGVKLLARVTVFSLPIVGSKLDEKLPSLPKGFEYSSPFVHALKVFAYAFSAFFTPICGVVLLPRSAIRLNQLLGLTEKQKDAQQSKVPPPPPMPENKPKPLQKARSEANLSPNFRRAPSLSNPAHTASPTQAKNQVLISPKQSPVTSSQDLKDARSRLRTPQQQAPSDLNPIHPTSPTRAKNSTAQKNPNQPLTPITSPQVLSDARTRLRSPSVQPKGVTSQSPEQKFINKLVEKFRASEEPEAQDQEIDDQFIDSSPPQAAQHSKSAETTPNAEEDKITTAGSITHTTQQFLTRSASLRVTSVNTGNVSSDCLLQIIAKRKYLEPPA